MTELESIAKSIESISQSIHLYSTKTEASQNELLDLGKVALGALIGWIGAFLQVWVTNYFDGKKRSKLAKALMIVGAMPQYQKLKETEFPASDDQEREKKRNFIYTLLFLLRNRLQKTEFRNEVFGLQDKNLLIDFASINVCLDTIYFHAQKDSAFPSFELPQINIIGRTSMAQEYGGEKEIILENFNKIIEVLNKYH